MKLWSIVNFVNFCCPVSPVTSISVSQCPAHPQQLPCHMLGPGRPSHPPQGTSGKGQCKPAWSQHVTAGFKPNGEANSVETGRCAARKHTVSLIPSPPMIPSYVGLLAFFPSCLKSKVYCKSCACDAGDMCSMRPSVSNHEKRTKKLPQFLPHPAQKHLPFHRFHSWKDKQSKKHQKTLRSGRTQKVANCHGPGSFCIFIGETAEGQTANNLLVFQDPRARCCANAHHWRLGAQSHSHAHL